MAQQCLFVHFASDTADKAQSISLYCIVLINLPEPTKLCFSWELPERQKVLFLSNFGIPMAVPELPIYPQIHLLRIVRDEFLYPLT